jgi:uncharacterized protein YerC
MPQVSRRLINKSVKDRILALFVSSIVLCKTESSAVSLIEDLLTPTEKIMLSKRFSIAFMLLEGYDYNTIEDILKVSRSTIGTVSQWLNKKGNGIRNVATKIKRHESMNKIWTEIQFGIAELFANSKGVNWRDAHSALRKLRRKAQKAY